MGIKRRLGTVVTVGLSAGLITFAAAAGPASAATAPGYGQFDGCPDVPDLYLCVDATISGGHLQLGATDTPISAPIHLNGGVPADGGPMQFSSTGGLTSPRLRVPGGLTGLTGLTWLENLVPFDALKVYARAELAGPAGDPTQSPTSLPLKIKLENPFLSGSCYIGSNANPLRLNLTTGTTTPPAGTAPITGVNPAFEFDPAFPDSTVYDFTGGTFVDNAFSAPKAAGCTLLLPGLGLIDPIVNLRAGLPSAAGKNVADFSFDAKAADPAAVHPH
jgi:hypothetical protein